MERTDSKQRLNALEITDTLQTRSYLPQQNEEQTITTTLNFVSESQLNHTTNACHGKENAKNALMSGISQHNFFYWRQRVTIKLN